MLGILIAYVCYKYMGPNGQGLIQEPPNIVLLETLGVFEMAKEKDRSRFAELLLEDDYGMMTKIVVGENRESDIIKAVCTQWLWGRGKKPVTWRTFVEVVNKVQWPQLTDDITKLVDEHYFDVADDQIDAGVALIHEPPNLVILQKLGIFDLIDDHKFVNILLGGKYMNMELMGNSDIQNRNREACRWWLSVTGRNVTWRKFIAAVNSTGFKQLAHNLLRIVDTKYLDICLLYTSPSPRDATLSRMPSSA